ncbi:hypothetical protein N9E22_01635 [Burkholderiales bacterium]|nr:hypothetical protein [Burkholderiales bacterium]
MISLPKYCNVSTNGNFVTERDVSGSLEFEKRPEGSKLYDLLQSGDGSIGCGVGNEETRFTLD